MFLFMTACSAPNTETEKSFDEKETNGVSVTETSDQTDKTKTSAAYKYMQKLLSEDDIVLEIRSEGLLDTLMFHGDAYVKTWADTPEYLLVEGKKTYSVKTENGKKTYTSGDDETISVKEYKQQILNSMFDDNKLTETVNGFEVFEPETKVESEITDENKIYETSDDTIVESNITDTVPIDPDEDIDGKTYLRIDGDDLVEEIRYLNGKTMAEIRYRIRPLKEEEKEYFSKS